MERTIVCFPFLIERQKVTNRVAQRAGVSTAQFYMSDFAKAEKSPVVPVKRTKDELKAEKKEQQEEKVWSTLAPTVDRVVAFQQAVESAQAKHVGALSVCVSTLSARTSAHLAALRSASFLDSAAGRSPR